MFKACAAKPTKQHINVETRELPVYSQQPLEHVSSLEWYYLHIKYTIVVLLCQHIFKEFLCLRINHN